MSFFDKVKGMMNPEDDYEDDDYIDNGDDFSFDDEPVAAPNTAKSAPAPKPAGSSMGLNSAALELKVVKPEKYDSQTAQKIADHLLNRRTVVLNLELTNKEAARRIREKEISVTKEEKLKT